jgi:putative ABC transport system permease protein
MFTDLTEILGGKVMLGMGQAACAIGIVLAVIVFCRLFAVRVEREALVAIVRGLIQMIAVGVALALLLHRSLGVGLLILLAMTVAAAVTASRRARNMKGSLMVCFWSIAAGAGVVIGGMIATRTLQTNIAMLVPVGSMIIANAMNAAAQAAERFQADVTAHIGQIEAGLALGAEPTVTVAPYVQSAVYASLLPRLDMLKSLGLVWIPGVMAGMMVSGASPVYAGIYQFILVVMILTASGIAGLVVTLLLRTRAFSSAAQLVMRGEPPRGDAPARHPQRTPTGDCYVSSRQSVCGRA